jgi:hypothetical protein
MSAAVTARPLTDRALEALRRAGNPFRNYFARNPDDEVCARYHVAELFAPERDQLLAVMDLYRSDPTAHSEVVPVLGNKGAGKTHLLHSIKHGTEGAWQLLVTPGVYQKDSDFLEYLLFQIIDTLLGGGRQKGVRPLDYVGDELARRLLGRALGEMPAAERAALFPAQGFSKWARRLGLGSGKSTERAAWLMDTLTARAIVTRSPMTVKRAIHEAGLAPEKALDIIAAYVERTETHNTAGLMRRAIGQGFCRAALLGDEAELAQFLTYGFAELPFNVRPSRQDLVLHLFKVLTDVFRTLKIPVVVAFDQLEDLLLARRSDDAHKIAEAFFAGIVQAMHQLDGLCFLVFAERGLWNRFVPSLDGYIQDRLNNPVHLPKFGTIKALRLEAPAPELARQVVEARLRPAFDELPDGGELPPIFPFTDEQVIRIARTEPTLRDMLIQLRHLFDHVVFGTDEGRSEPRLTDAPFSRDAQRSAPPTPTDSVTPTLPDFGYTAPESPELPAPPKDAAAELRVKSVAVVQSAESRLTADVEEQTPDAVLERTRAGLPFGDRPDGAESEDRPAGSPMSFEAMSELWDQEQRSARRRLEPEGALTGATRELQAGLGAFLQVCHEHGVKVGPWRLQHVVGEWSFGEHPTYGVLTIAHWACKDGTPWKVGIGLFLAKGPGKPKDLEIKLAAMDSEPVLLDHLILLRPEDDLTLSGKSKALWADAEKRGRHARLEALSLDSFAVLSSFPRWLAALTESLPDGQPLPNLADLIQEKCERLLEQVCMPVQG